MSHILLDLPKRLQQLDVKYWVCNSHHGTSVTNISAPFYQSTYPLLLYQDWRQNHWAYLFSASVNSLTVQIWKTCSMSSSASLPIILTLLTQSPKNTWPFFKNFWYVRKPLEYIYTIFFLLLCSPEEKKNTIYISFRS